MNSQQIFSAALGYEENIRDLYLEAAEKIDDPRGKSIFSNLAKDEQSHLDFLHYGLEQLKKSGNIDVDKLQTPVPTKKQIEADLEKLRQKIPERMLGDIKTVLSNALQLEVETSAFYREACSSTEGEIQAVFQRLLEIEERHVNLVQIELDHASNSGIWFDFMEVDMED
jgi:rubrerythrin